MLWSDRVPRLTGIVLLLLALCLLLSVLFFGAVSDANPFERDEIDDLLVDIDDNQGLAIVSFIFAIFVDSIFGIAAAAGLYLLLRDRSRPYALAGLVFLLAASAASIAGDGGDVALINLASDFAEGGPEGVDAGDASILEIARTVAIFSSVSGQIAFTALNVGILAFAAIIGWAPSGAVNPPRWIAWIAVVSGVAGLLSWFIVLGDWAFVFFIISGIATLIWLAALGGWLLMSSEETASAQPATAV